jgi:hypothetical protein
MIDGDGHDERYFPERAELDILIPNLRLYFKFPKRSQGRKERIDATLKQLAKHGNRHWTERNICIWFTNNQRQYTDECESDDGAGKPQTYAKSPVRRSAPSTPLATVAPDPPPLPEGGDGRRITVAVSPVDVKDALPMVPDLSDWNAGEPRDSDAADLKKWEL